MSNELVSVFDDFFGKHNRLVGFKDLFNEFSTDFQTTTFPPYNICQTDDGQNIDIATAGFKKDELKVTFDEGNHILQISGEKSIKDDKKYTYKGIANRSFSLKWKMNPSLEFGDCSYEDGILHLEFKDKPKEKSSVKCIEIK